eukprot:12886714-Prorocentrum_lima.AAC.1
MCLFSLGSQKVNRFGGGLRPLSIFPAIRWRQRCVRWYVAKWGDTRRVGDNLLSHTRAPLCKERLRGESVAGAY